MKTKNRRILTILSALLLLVAVAVLGACGETPDTPDPGITPEVADGSIVFRNADGTVIETVTGKEGSEVTYRPTTEGYRSFTAYGDKALMTEVSIPATMPKGTTDIYIRWTNPITYTVAFDSGRGIGAMESLRATYGERVTLPKNAFILRGETFSEWRATLPDGKTMSFIDGARVKNLTATDGATVTFVALYETADSKNFTVEDGVVTAYNGTADTLVFPEGAAVISADVFQACATAGNIRKITVPAGYTTIEKGAFTACTSLEYLSLPFIGGSADENNFLAYLFGADSYLDNTYSFSAEYNVLYGLQIKNQDFSSLVIPQTLKTVAVTSPLYTIPEGAFYRMYSLEKLIVADYSALYAVGAHAFDGCWQLGYSSDFGVQNPLWWLENVETIGDSAFAAYISEANDEGSQYTFTRIFEIPSLGKIESVGKNAFYGCVYLMKLSFGDRLRTIDAYAFTNCASLTEIVLPDSLESVGEYAFTSCAAVTDLTLGSGLRDIGSFAFADCTALATVTLRGDAPAKTAKVPFANEVEYKYNSAGQITDFVPVFTHMKFVVNVSSATAYREKWPECASRIESVGEQTETVVYYDKRADGTFTAKLRIVGDIVYVTDPFGEFLDVLDVLGTAGDLGKEYTLFAKVLGSDTVTAVGDEIFLELTNSAILDYMGEDMYPTTVRIRPASYEKDGKTYEIATAEFLSDYGTLGNGDGSLYKIVDDGYGHAVLYERESAADEFMPAAVPAGTVYSEIYLYVTLAYSEQYLAVVYEDKYGDPFAYRYFYTSGSKLIPAEGEKTGTAMTFLSYGDVQITVDGRGNAKVTRFVGSNLVEYIGAYTAAGEYGDDTLTVTLLELVGENDSVAGTAVFDGYFDGSYHRCRISLTQGGTVVYKNTIYSSGGRTSERYNINSADGSEYCFYDYDSEDGSRSFRYVEFINSEKKSSHGTYRLDGKNIIIDVENYAERTGIIDDIRMSFHFEGVVMDTEYKAFGYDEDYTFYMSEDFYGTTIDYYEIRMDGYGNARFHDTHDDDTDIWYTGTYYNTGRYVKEDAYGKFWVYCFTGTECDAKGNVKENGATATYYYVTDSQVYQYSDDYDYYGLVVSVSLSEGSTAHTVTDEYGMTFAELDIDPFGITEITLYTYTFENGKPVYTKDEEKTAKVTCIASLDNSGTVACVAVYDLAGNFLFLLSPDENGEWIYTSEHVFVPADATDDALVPDVSALTPIG